MFFTIRKRQWKTISGVGLLLSWSASKALREWEAIGEKLLHAGFKSNRESLSVVPAIWAAKILPSVEI